MDRGDDEVETLVFTEENWRVFGFSGCHFDCDIEPLIRRGIGFAYRPTTKALLSMEMK